MRRPHRQSVRHSKITASAPWARRGIDGGFSGRGGEGPLGGGSAEPGGAVRDQAPRAFGRRGFHNTSLDEIAEALGASKPALYR
jgi:hypothetical protein